jgi:hypothetical protein
MWPQTPFIKVAMDEDGVFHLTARILPGIIEAGWWLSLSRSYRAAGFADRPSGNHN